MRLCAPLEPFQQQWIILFQKPLEVVLLGVGQRRKLPLHEWNQQEIEFQESPTATPP